MSQMKFEGKLAKDAKRADRGRSTNRGPREKIERGVWNEDL